MAGSRKNVSSRKEHAFINVRSVVNSGHEGFSGCHFFLRTIIQRQQGIRTRA